MGCPMKAREFLLIPGRAQGFTLVELLVVVVILAIIAAIVVPQFSSATDDAKESVLASNLARMRSAVDLYKEQHGHYPGDADASGASCPGGGTPGVGTTASAALRATAFAEELTMYTSLAGLACSTTDTTFKFGPYLKTAELGEAGLPDNPVTAANAIAVVTSGNLSMTSVSTTGGWKYDAVIGKLIADHQDFDDI